MVKITLFKSKLYRTKYVLLLLILIVFILTTSFIYEKRKTIRPVFHYFSPALYGKIFVADVDSILGGFYSGIEITNYYFITKPSKGYNYSDRFNYKSKYFQSWVGVYVVNMGMGCTPNENNKQNFKSIINFDFKYFIDIVIADQKAWLKIFGKIDNPIVYLEKDSGVAINTIKINNDFAYKIEYTIVSNIDIGNNTKPTLEIPNIPYNSTWESAINEYQLVKLKCSMFIKYYENYDVVTMAYFNGISYTDKNNITYNTYDSIKDDFSKMCSNITISASN